MSDSGPPRRDSGLQPERTALAWRRLALILLGFALASTRLLWPTLGAWALLPTSALATAALILLSASQRRYLGHQPGRTTPDGWLPALAAVACTGAAVVVLLVVISGG